MVEETYKYPIKLKQYNTLQKNTIYINIKKQEANVARLRSLSKLYNRDGEEILNAFRTNIHVISINKTMFFYDTKKRRRENALLIIIKII